MDTNSNRRIASISFAREACARCLGSGRLTEFAHVHGGVCFSCNGSGRKLTRSGAARKATSDAVLAERLVVDPAAVEVGTILTWGAAGARGRLVSYSAPVEGQGTAEILPDGTRLYFPSIVLEHKGGERRTYGSGTFRRPAGQDDLLAVLAAFGKARTGFTVTYHEN